MSRISKKYAYPLVIIAMLASTALQIAWLAQLYNAQEAQVKKDLELVAGNTARMSHYLSAVPGHENNVPFRNFFLSPEWLEFDQAYNNMRYHHVPSQFSANVEGDSTYVEIRLTIPKTIRKGPHKVERHYENGESPESDMAADKRDIERLDSLLNREMIANHISIKYFKALYIYDDGALVDSSLHTAIEKAAYRSERFLYNLHILHSFQLVAPSLTGIVLYRMRYYLLSSVLMLLLTGIAFYFVFRLLRSQRLYAQAQLSFTSNMTHEFKTPVAIIEAALDSITRYNLSNDPAKMERYISISQQELQRLNLMIEKVLNLDELDNGQTRLKPELYDAQQGLEQVTKAMQLQASGITYHPSGEPCFLYGDPVHLTNVFYNLIDNALKYGGENVRVDVYCACDKDKITIRVKDNGPGIARIYQQRIFERFFRVQANVNVHSVKGSGLGLYYVKQIVEKHDGRIRLVSEVGKGSEFIIELPVYHEV
jgi:signal transduction histidine kinase